MFFSFFHFIIVVIQSLSPPHLFATPWTAAHQSSLSLIISQSLLKLMSIESTMPSNHLILSHPFLLLPSIFPSIRVFSSELALCIKWTKYWSFSFSISPSIRGWFPLGLTGLISLISFTLSFLKLLILFWRLLEGDLQQIHHLFNCSYLSFMFTILESNSELVPKNVLLCSLHIVLRMP